jgi:hypothetical protein
VRRLDCPAPWLDLLLIPVAAWAWEARHAVRCFIVHGLERACTALGDPSACWLADQSYALAVRWGVPGDPILRCAACGGVLIDDEDVCECGVA